MWSVTLVFGALFFNPAGASRLDVRSLSFDSNVSESLKLRVTQDLEWVASIVGTGSSPLHHEIFGPVDGARYSQWFHSRVFYFGVDRCGGSSAVACVKRKYANKMFVTQNFIRSSVPQVGRVSTLFHEARHTEFDQGMWPHARCPRNFPHRSQYTGRRLANKTACDSNPRGSYSSAAILMKNISEYCSNCNEKTRADAAIYGGDQLKRVIGDAAQIVQADLLF